MALANAARLTKYRTRAVLTNDLSRQKLKLETWRAAQELSSAGSPLCDRKGSRGNVRNDDERELQEPTVSLE